MLSGTLEGSGRLWNALGASERLWEALRGSGRLWEALGASGRFRVALGDISAQKSLRNDGIRGLGDNSGGSGRQFDHIAKTLGFCFEK